MCGLYLYFRPFWTHNWYEFVKDIGPTITGLVTVLIASYIAILQWKSMEKARKHHYIARYVSNYELVEEAWFLYIREGESNEKMMRLLARAKNEADLFSFDQEIVEFTTQLSDHAYQICGFSVSGLMDSINPDKKAMAQEKLDSHIKALKEGFQFEKILKMYKKQIERLS